jgi:hypothetical protein
LDYNYYKAKRSDYESQKINLEKLRKFVLATVNPDYVTTCCQNDDPMGLWCTKLQSRCGQTITDEKIEARNAYKNAHKPPKFLKDAITWLDRWETVMARAQTKGVTKAAASLDWAMDFFIALSPIAS